MVHICVMLPSTAAFSAAALLWPLQRMSTSRAAITVPTPTVSAWAGLGYHFLILSTLGVEVGRIAVKDVDVLLGAVNMVEEVLGHEGVVAFRVFLRKVHIFVHVERQDVLETYAAFLAGFDEALVHSDRRRPGGQTQYEGLFFSGLGGVNLVYDVVGCPFGQLLVSRLNDYSHDINSFKLTV